MAIIVSQIKTTLDQPKNEAVKKVFKGKIHESKKNSCGFLDNL